MTDDKKPPREVGDIDWDQALAEWEKENFLPEIAKDVLTDKSLDHPVTPPSRPLYRPASLMQPEPEREDDERDGNEDEGATIVAAIPRELLRAGDAASRPGSRGGLGQLFARDERREPISGAAAVGRPQRTAWGGDASEPQSTPAAASTGSPGGPFLIAPQARHFDPDDVTKAKQAPIGQLRVARDDGQEALERSSVPAVGANPRRWADERPASDWLTEEARQGFASRAAWLEKEARALDDASARARGLLACSEIMATTGDLDRARALAVEARDIAPSLAMAHWQARGLTSPPRDERYVEALDAEVAMTLEGPAKIHATWLAADALRAAGRDEAVAQRLEHAARLAVGDNGSANDVRPFVALAVRALSRGESASPALRLPHTGEVAPIAEAAEACLRLRGADWNGSSPREPLSSELLLRVRQALNHEDAAKAALFLSELAHVPELFAPATWLAAALGSTRPASRRDAARSLGDLSRRGDRAASGAWMARAIELGDPELLAEAMDGRGPMTPAERVTLAVLGGRRLSALDPALDAIAEVSGMGPLAAAAAAIAPSAGDDRPAELLARAGRTAGSSESRARVRLGRLLSASAPLAEVDAALRDLGESKPSEAQVLGLEMAARAGRAVQLGSGLRLWGARCASDDVRATAPLAAALVAEWAGDEARALEGFKAARAANPTSEAALRAVASLEQVDLVAEVNALADDLTEGLPSAVARLEAVTRGEEALPEPTRAHLLELAHRAAPTFPIPAFIAERIAHRSGDVEEAVRWVRERRAQTVDSIESALDNVREALLLADREPALAAERLAQAHRAHPADVALRELYERMAPEPPDDRGAWRERRAEGARGDARTLLLLEAVREYERLGQEEAALRCADAAAVDGGSIGRIARERAELRAGRVARLADELLSLAKGAADPRTRCEAYERLAELDARARSDPGSALLWHRAILEELPEHLPSLRHVEHHLIGEGRDDELEPIASAIARVLRGTGSGECGAHAELAARLRARGAEGTWEASREMAELAADEAEPSLWSLRMQQAHARARADDSTFLAATLKLVDRASRAPEAAVLLVRAGEAAARLQRFDEARLLLERAATEDPGDIVTWSLLVEVRRRSGDHQGAAEACEALARSSVLPAHQLAAWYEAARIWSAEGKDEERAIVAFETVAAIDVGHEDVFAQLSSIYASRKMQPELASLLERRIACVASGEERLAMEVRRGRILLEVGDADGARRAFEAALAEHPDDGGALSAFADLCVVQRDWVTAEQALVRLARLLPTVEEQRSVYARLGELYARHLLNLSRAEVAFNEVLRRAPDDQATMEKLVDVYRRQSDPARAIPLQQQLVALAHSAEEKRNRVIDLAMLHEQTAHDNRRAEQTLEAARREFPQDVAVLRAFAEFLVRHGQTAASEGLVERTGEEARRLLAAGRLSPQILDVMATVFDLRGNRDGTLAARAMLAALEGQPAVLRGAGPRAFDGNLDELLAPDLLSPALRALLARTGDALDAASPIDLPSLNAKQTPSAEPVARLAASIAQAMGLGQVQLFTSARLGTACIPIRSSPPTILVGGTLAGDVPSGGLDEAVATFLLVRALKLVSARASALTRTPPAELAVLISAWLKCLNPSWQPQGIDPTALNVVGALLQATLPRQVSPELRATASAATHSLGTHAASLGGNALAWANRVALLALGNPSAALDAIAASNGSPTGAPRDRNERLAWATRTSEARDLLAFGAGASFAEAQSRLGGADV